MPSEIYWFLFIVFASWIFYSLLFFTFFWYEAVNEGYWEEIGKKYSVNLKLFSLVSILKSIYCLMRVWLYWPIRYFHNYWKLPDSSPTHVPVVFVHGYLHNRSAWVKYFRWLRREGYSHLLAIDLRGKFNSIETYARQLSREIEELTRNCGAEKVDIVAHSMGGLVSRYYIQKLGGDKKVRKLVTLGTPHNGTKVAVFVVGKARKEMLPKSGFFKEIEIKDARSMGNSRLIVMYSDSDFMIIPTYLARVEVEGVENTNVGLTSHIGFIYNRTVFEKVLSALSSS